MFLNSEHKSSFLNLTNENTFLNKGQLFVLSFDNRMYKILKDHTTNEIVNWDVLLSDSQLTNDEKILFSLIRSFGQRQKKSFSTDLFYQINDIEYLKIALSALQAHFSLDVYPYTFSPMDSGESIIKDDSFFYSLPEEQLISQKEIANLFNQNGIEGDVRKVNAYKSKGYLPEPDVKAGNGYLWRASKIKRWIDDYNAGKIINRRNRQKN